jgi:hypothetical protein
MEAVADAQVKGDFKAAGAALRKASLQVEAIASALAEATVTIFPSRFRPATG